MVMSGGEEWGSHGGTSDGWQLGIGIRPGGSTYRALAHAWDSGVFLGNWNKRKAEQKAHKVLGAQQELGVWGVFIKRWVQMAAEGPRAQHAACWLA